MSGSVVKASVNKNTRADRTMKDNKRSKRQNSARATRAG